MAAAPSPSLRSEKEATTIIQTARIAMFGAPLFPTFSPRGEKGQEQSPAKAGGFPDPLFETLKKVSMRPIPQRDSLRRIWQVEAISAFLPGDPVRPSPVTQHEFCAAEADTIEAPPFGGLRPSGSLSLVHSVVGSVLTLHRETGRGSCERSHKKALFW